MVDQETQLRRMRENAQKTCGRKIPYSDEASAEIAMGITRAWAKGNRVPRGGILNVYQCAACGKWHVGNKRY